MNTHRLLIAGHELTLRSPASEAHVEHLANLVDAYYQRAASLTKAQSAQDVAAWLLTALDLADALDRERQALASLRQALRDESQRLENQIENLEALVPEEQDPDTIGRAVLIP